MNEQEQLRNVLTTPMQLAGLVGKSATAREKLVAWCESLPGLMAELERVSDSEDRATFRKDECACPVSWAEVLQKPYNFNTVADLTEAMQKLKWPISPGWKMRPPTEKLLELKYISARSKGKPQKNSPTISMVQHKLGLSEITGAWDQTTDKVLKEKVDDEYGIDVKDLGDMAYSNIVWALTETGFLGKEWYPPGDRLVLRVALQQFQMHRGLPSHGRLDQVTYSALHKAANEAQKTYGVYSSSGPVDGNG